MLRRAKAAAAKPVNDGPKRPKKDEEMVYIQCARDPLCTRPNRHCGHCKHPKVGEAAKRAAAIKAGLPYGESNPEDEADAALRAAATSSPCECCDQQAPDDQRVRVATSDPSGGQEWCLRCAKGFEMWLDDLGNALQVDPDCDVHDHALASAAQHLDRGLDPQAQVRPRPEP